MSKTIKGITREYRKCLKKLGVTKFPRTGAFHLTRNDEVVQPADVIEGDAIVIGARPAIDKDAVKGVIDRPPDTPLKDTSDTIHAPSPAPVVHGCTPVPSEFCGLRDQITRVLRERGFGECIKHSNAACWPIQSEFWRPLTGDAEVWCLAFEQDAIQFGVHSRLLQTMLALPGVGSFDKFVEQSQGNPDFPVNIREMHVTFQQNGQEYEGIEVGTSCSIVNIRAIIAELVNAFVHYMTGNRPWSPPGNGGGGNAQSGVIWKQTVPMPDPRQAPFHGFTVIANKITEWLKRYGYNPEPMKGSYSWVDYKKERYFKFCFYGEWEWWFGVRRDLVESWAASQEKLFDFRFHVPPNASAVFHGFRVFDTTNSIQRIEAVIDGCTLPSWTA